MNDFEFPSPFNEDHFISDEISKLAAYFIGFRPLLTRIISYLYLNHNQIKASQPFPSPFNEDHFISEVVEDAGFLKFVEFPSPFNEDHFISK